MALLAPERHERILAHLRTHGTVTVQQIAEDLFVTRETVRRDLDQLESAGSLRRVHGGAVSSSPSSRTETSWRDRRSSRAEQKQTIARAALEFLPPAGTGSLLMDAGTSTEALADLIAEEVRDADPAGSRMLITNAVPIAQKLSDVGAVDVEILGGQVRGLTGAVVGEQALATLARRQADVAFLGTNGVDAAFGLSTPDAAEAAMKSALLRAARTSVLLADSSKLGRSTLIRFAELKEISVLITDAEPEAELAEALEAAEVTVVVAVPR
ncbi:DeoR/GlpR family DNA-binding transcription regulator [Nesterenkonia xinjiangensis]|uniref:Lactose phosphotransferase system repressor n=1 Tax=Nesterenkonia xinjiangensis TaxID=225327 RepID=A0A7Z0GJP7_9MICC|nr:DeoR/GlpR family DNA-binding transcription regulator [Nesterenkonia xinjiangensis]NYJ77249.1 DeoR family fructose operon transcriptional repressor [Nesterenkonia xinjiangensis]